MGHLLLFRRTIVRKCDGNSDLKLDNFSTMELVTQGNHGSQGLVLA